MNSCSKNCFMEAQCIIQIKAELFWSKIHIRKYTALHLLDCQLILLFKYYYILSSLLPQFLLFSWMSHVIYLFFCGFYSDLCISLSLFLWHWILIWLACLSHYVIRQGLLYLQFLVNLVHILSKLFNNWLIDHVQDQRY